MSVYCTIQSRWTRRLRTCVALQVIFVILIACGKKTEATPPLANKSNATAAPTPKVESSKSDYICSLVPSQSAVVSGIASSGGGTAAVTAALAEALGISVVAHSSGAAILTGSGGYIAGTIGSAAAAGPIIVTVGATVAGLAVGVELLCAPKNHPDLVRKVTASAEEFARRTKSGAAISAKKAGNFVATNVVTLLKSGDEAIAYANRKVAEVGERLKP
jgi:hypothetical protein